MKRMAVVLALAAAAIAAAPAGATNECRGLQVCVPVVGPWVLTAGTTEVRYQLSCPRRFVVAGLDAELSDRRIDIGFVGGMGSPVNPGITTSQAAIFLGRYVGRRNGAPSFRPHIGCVPASGGGQRVPTAYHVFPPGKPTNVQVRELPVLPGTTGRFVERCPVRQQLAGATHALAFYTDGPPTAALAHSVTVTQTIRNGGVHVTVHGAPELSVRAVVQLDLVCVAGA
jgi:hypothetical protein